MTTNLHIALWNGSWWVEDHDGAVVSGPWPTRERAIESMENSKPKLRAAIAKAKGETK